MGCQSCSKDFPGLAVCPFTQAPPSARELVLVWARAACPPPPWQAQDIHRDMSLEDLVRGSSLANAKKDKFVEELTGNGLDLTVAAWWGMSDEERKVLTSPALRLYMQGVLKRTEAGP
jgi:hypothetical protein